MALANINTGPQVAGTAFETMNPVKVGAPVIKEFVAAGKGSTAPESVSDLIDNFPASVDTLTGTRLVYSIVATSNISAAVNWREIY